MIKMDFEWIIAYLAILMIVISTAVKIVLHWKKTQLFFKDSEERLANLDQEIELALKKKCN